MKPIKIDCPICTKTIHIDPEIDLVICQNCGQMFKVRVEITLEQTKYEKIL